MVLASWHAFCLIINPGSIVQGLQADQIRAEVNWRAIWEGAWRVERIDVVSFEGTLRPGSPDGEGTDADDSKSAPTRGLASFLPQRFELGELNIAQARVGFRGKDGQEALAMQNSALQVRPEGNGWAIDGNGGTLTIPSRPALSITSFGSRIQGATFFLTESNFRLGDAGKITASGEFASDSKLRVPTRTLEPALTLRRGLSRSRFRSKNKFSQVCLNLGRPRLTPLCRPSAAETSWSR